MPATDENHPRKGIVLTKVICNYYPFMLTQVFILYGESYAILTLE